MSCPSSRTAPPVGTSSSPAMCSSVDFPAPDGATSATTSPAASVRLAPSSTVTAAGVPGL